MKKRRLKKDIRTTLKLIGVVALVAYYVWYMVDLDSRGKQYDNLINPILEVEAYETDPIDECEEKSTDVYFTNYFMGDGSSGTTTASGLKVTDFEVSDEGWYTYKGMIVVATANATRLKRGFGEGYMSHELYEELTLEISGERHHAVVLDVCGSCYYTEGEFLQRYDIFTTGNVIGKVIGQIVQECTVE